MQHADYLRAARLRDESTRVVLGVARMDNERLPHFCRQRDLSGEYGALGSARRIVVVIIETALAYGDSRPAQEGAELGNVTRSVETGRVVGMDSSGGENESAVFRGALRGDGRGRQRLTDADDGDRARLAGAGDYLVAVAGERRVREVGVAVDEDTRAPVLRGHLRSIQRSTGAAT